MPKRKLTISLKRDEAVTVSRVSIGKQKMVYVLVCDKRLRYPNGESRVAYIGTTEKGLSRIAQSVAARAEDILALLGVRNFHARVVTCASRQHVRTWRKLERAMLLRFRELYGVVPRCNSQGKNMKVVDEFQYFREKRVDAIIEELS